MLEGLRTHGLLKGRHLGINSSVMEAHTSVSGLVRRNDEKSYWNYVRELAQEAGVDGEVPAAVARFDRRREGRKTSNKECVNLAEPIVGTESGAIITAAAHPGDAGDTGNTGDLSGRVLDAVALVEEIRAILPGTLPSFNQSIKGFQA